MIGRPKKDLPPRTQTTARIEKDLQKRVQIRCIEIGSDQTAAINDGLRLWLLAQDHPELFKMLAEVLGSPKSAKLLEPIMETVRTQWMKTGGKLPQPPADIAEPARVTSRRA